MVETRAKKYTFLCSSVEINNPRRHSLQNPSRKKREMRSLAAGLHWLQKRRPDWKMPGVCSDPPHGTDVIRNRHGACNPLKESTLLPHADGDLESRDDAHPQIACEKPWFSKAVRLLGCGDSRSADSRSSLVHSPVQSMDGVCKPLPSSCERFVSRGLRSQTVLSCRVCLDSFKLHGMPCVAVVRPRSLA